MSHTPPSAEPLTAAEQFEAEECVAHGLRFPFTYARLLATIRDRDERIADLQEQRGLPRRFDYRKWYDQKSALEKQLAAQAERIDAVLRLCDEYTSSEAWWANDNTTRDILTSFVKRIRAALQQPRESPHDGHRTSENPKQDGDFFCLDCREYFKFLPPLAPTPESTQVTDAMVDAAIESFNVAPLNQGYRMGAQWDSHRTWMRATLEAALGA